MWRDGLTVIALASGLPDRKPDYLTFEQATEASCRRGWGERTWIGGH
jgi:hypothetical protein